MGKVPPEPFSNLLDNKIDVVRLIVRWDSDHKVYRTSQRFFDNGGDSTHRLSTLDEAKAPVAAYLFEFPAVVVLSSITS
jgi:hypothetical protein